MPVFEELQQRAVHLLQAHDFEAAQKWAAAGILVDENHGELWQVRGIALRMLGRFREAASALETATTLIPLNVFAQCALADSYARLGKRKLASFLYRRLLKEKQCPTQLLPAVSSGAGAIGDYACALNVCRQIVRREPDHHAAIFGIAFYMEKLDYHPEEIVHWVKEAFRLRPQSVTYRLSYASTLEYLGRVPAARELLVDIDVRSIHCSRILNRMAEIFAKAGDAASTCRCASRMAALRPKAPGV